MNQGFLRLLTEKKTYYALLIIVTLAALLLLSADIFSQSRDARRQIIDEDGAEELSVNSRLQTEEELRLQEMLEHISGVGKNRVMITPREEQQTLSVFSSQEKKPEVCGVIVAAEGANNASVKLAIVEAVASAYGVPTTSVMVFQLKQ